MCQATTKTVPIIFFKKYLQILIQPYMKVFAFNY